MNKRLLTFFLFVLFFTACSSHPSTMIASTSPLSPGVRGTIPTKGTSCQYYLLGLIPLTTSPDSQDALEDAKDKANADVLTDVTIDENSGYYILFSNHCIRVRGLGVASAKER